MVNHVKPLRSDVTVTNIYIKYVLIFLRFQHHCISIVPLHIIVDVEESITMRKILNVKIHLEQIQFLHRYVNAQQEFY